MTELLPKHGGYRKLKSFQVAQPAYDVTARFCERYIDRRSRTHDQMVQAARSGVQNIAEGSQASGTLEFVVGADLCVCPETGGRARGRRPYGRGRVRQRGMEQWDAYEPLGRELVQARCETADDVAQWVRGVHERLGASNGSSGSNESSCLEQTRSAGPAGCPGETGKSGRTGRTG